MTSVLGLVAGLSLRCGLLAAQDQADLLVYGATPGGIAATVAVGSEQLPKLSSQPTRGEFIRAAWRARQAATAALGDSSVVTRIPGLVAFWTFGEDADQPRLSIGAKDKHPLAEVGGPIPRVPGGPFSGYTAELNGKQYFRIPYAETGDLNISGPNAQVSMFAAVRIVNLRQSRTIAGMWSEGKGANDDSGTRQYALLMNMPTYGGPNKLVPHISSEGGVTRRADDSPFPGCCDYAVTAHAVCTPTRVSLLTGRSAVREMASEAHRHS